MENNSKTFIEQLIKDGIDSSKIEAITTTEGPLLIIAGPGSGKTKTLIERIVYLIINDTPAENIMVATFTEKAAKELITRVSNRLLDLKLKINLNEMYIGTLHSIFLRILEENREFTKIKRNYRLLDQFDQKYLVFRNISEYLKVDGLSDLLGSDKINRWTKADKLIYYISKVSEECLDLDILCNADEEKIKAIGELYKIYKKQLEGENALDFASIQTETLSLLKNNPSVLKALHEKIRYIMIDEYQDTNTIQEKIILLLTSKNKNICVVGDDDQGLYRFRGATIRNILEFPNNFKKGFCKQVSLTTNYRSHPDIINFYNNWMNELPWSVENNNFRYEKTIVPRKDKFPKVPAVIKVSNKGTFEEYSQEVLDFIRHLESSGTISNLNQIAFLFKSVKNDKVIALANFLEANNIKIFSPRSALFFEREEVQLLFGALIFIFPGLFLVLDPNSIINRYEDLNLDNITDPVLVKKEIQAWKEKKAANADNNNVSENLFQLWVIYTNWKTKFAQEIRKNPIKHEALLKWCQRRSKEHLSFEQNTNYAFTSLIYQLLEFPMFADYLQVDLNDNITSLRSAYNIALVTKLLFKFEYLYNITVLTPKNIRKTQQELFNVYLRYIMDGGLEEYEDFEEYAPSGCISFMTIHQSKGLEFPIVLVGSLNLNPTKNYNEVDEILQNKYYLKPPFEPIEEIKNFDFRRLFYTAFSRPQNLLILTTKEKDGVGRSPSKHFNSSYISLKSWRDKSFDVTKIKLEKIKPVNIKKVYSFTSHILLYENCPLQYKFYKELEFVEVRTGSALGGSLLHQTIEDIHKAVLRNEVNMLTDKNITDWFNTNYYLLSKSQRSYLHEAQQKSILNQILRYRDNQSNRWHLIKEAEVDVSLVKEDYILKGAIDLIEGENSTVELIDFKSGDKPDINSEEPKTKQILAQYRRQLEVYAHLIEERIGQKVSKLHLYYPKEEDSSPYITFNANKDNIQHTISTFDEVVHKIESKNYDMKNIPKTEKQCGNCDMRYHCNPRQYNN